MIHRCASLAGFRIDGVDASRGHRPTALSRATTSTRWALVSSARRTGGLEVTATLLSERREDPSNDARRRSVREFDIRDAPTGDADPRPELALGQPGPDTLSSDIESV